MVKEEHKTNEKKKKKSKKDKQGKKKKPKHPKVKQPTLKELALLVTDDPGSNQCVKIAIIGNVDSGKSTLVGVLTKGGLDDGRGSSRLKVFNFAHEVENGRTSSIAHEIMGFDEENR